MGGSVNFLEAKISKIPINKLNQRPIKKSNGNPNFGSMVHCISSGFGRYKPFPSLTDAS